MKSNGSSYGPIFQSLMGFTDDLALYAFRVACTMVFMWCQWVPVIYRFSTIWTILFYSGEFVLFCLYARWLGRRVPSFGEQREAERLAREKFYNSKDGKSWAELNATLESIARKHNIKD